MPFLVGAWAGTVRLDERWLGNLATVVVGGIMQGGVYAMFALGLTLIFGVMRIINAAHGEMVMMGAYLTWVAFFYLGVDPLLSIVLTLPIAFVFGVVVQKLLLDAAVGAPELTGLLITFGLGLAMIYTAELIFTTDFRTIPYAPGTVQLTSAIAVGQNRVISFVLAVLETLVSFMVPNGPAMVELAADGLMISVLLIRPGGLMGVKEG